MYAVTNPHVIVLNFTNDRTLVMDMTPRIIRKDNSQNRFT